MGSCCCKDATMATRPSPKSLKNVPSAHNAVKNASSSAHKVVKCVSIDSSGATSEPDDDDDDVGSILTSTIVLAEGKPLDFAKNDNMNLGEEEEGGDTRIVHLRTTETTMTKNESFEESTHNAHGSIMRMDQIGGDESFFPSTRITQNDADGPRRGQHRRDQAFSGFFSRPIIEECCPERNEADAGYALDTDECNAQTLALMKSTAEVATGQYPKISSDDVKQLSSNFMKVETDQDRDVQDTFQMAACRQVPSLGYCLFV